MNKIIITYIFFIIIGLSNYGCSAQEYTLLPEEANVAQLISDLVAPGKGMDPCLSLTCERFDEDYYYVAVIDLGFILDNYVSLDGIDISVFKYLKSLVMNEYVYPSTQINILSQLASLNHLEVISIYNLVEGINVELPQSLISIAFYNFKGTFYSKWVNSNLVALVIQNSIDFSIIGTFSKNQALSTLSIPVASSNGLPTNLDSVFPNLKYFTVYMKNITSSIGDSVIPSSYLGSFSFPNLESLSFLLDPNTTSTSTSISIATFSKLYYLPDFSKLNSLSSLVISCDAFTLKSNQKFDLSNISNNHNLDVKIENNNNLFKSCSDCLKLRQNTRLVMNNVQVIIDSFDLSTCSKISLDYIGPNQIITFKTFNFNQTTGLSISNSLVSGDLPDDLCKVSFESVDIHDNLFSSRVPSCYLCTSNSEIRDSILPNQFSLNFTTYTPASCQNFKINSLEEYNLMDTFGGSVYISGYDLGFLVSFNGDYYESKWEVVNQVLRIDIGSGIGSEYKVVNMSILDDKIITFKYSYIAPTLLAYYIDSNSNTLNLVGSGFDYNNEMNLVTIASTQESVKLNVTGSLDYSPHISIPLDRLESLLKEGQSFSAKVFVQDQESSSLSLVYGTESISITDTSITLNTTGSTVTVVGYFLKGTSGVSKVNLVIGGIVCTVSKVSSTSLTFTYPKSTKNIGTTALSLIINGRFYTTNVYINLIQDNSSASSNDNNNSASSDYISLSSKIIIPNILYIINFIIINLYIINHFK